VDGLGRAYVTGRTASNSWFPSNVPGYDKSTNGSNDAFVVRVNP
jgi:hypothetical protein